MTRSKSLGRTVLTGLLVALLPSLGVAVPLAAQSGPPSTDLFLLELGPTEAGSVAESCRRLTERAGYDNQPAFSPDGRRLYYTSIRDGQADIWQIELESGEAGVVLSTPESEYSPTPIPGEESLSVVRVEEDGTQRLWRIPLDGSRPTLLLPEVAPVGYHAWAGTGRLALFVLGEPNTLQRVLELSGVPEEVARDIGRSLQTLPGGDEISFVQKSEKGARVMGLAFPSGVLRDIAPTLSDGEDHVWSPDGTLWMARGSSLYRWSGEEWEQVADLAASGAKEISRLAISPDGRRMALVSE